MAEKKRELWADYAKGICILLVFIGVFNAVINFLLAPRSKVPQAKSNTEESK